MKRWRAIVVGTGAGGAPAAATLAERWGDEVLVLEAGPWLHARDFTQVERTLIPRLYAAAGTQGTEDGAVGFLQGAAVGGSTLINDALCFRPPPEVPERWSRYGVDLDPTELSALADEVEATLDVCPIPREMIHRAAYLVGLGAARRGWAVERLRHNARGCLQCGFRHLGCAYDAKRSMNLTYVPLAVERGAVLRPETTVLRVEALTDGWRVHTRGGVEEATTVVLCAGVVQTPTILLRSGIRAGEGVQVHLQAVAWGDFEDPVDAFAGIPMSMGVLEFADVYGHQGPGYLIESVAVQPLAFSSQVQGEGPDHDAFLERYRHLAGALSLVRSRSRGRIRLVGDRPAIDYPLGEHDIGCVRHFYARAVELFEAAGARRTLLAHRHLRWTDAPPPDDLPMEPGDAYLYTAHPFGGANRGDTTDAVGRVKGAPGLWVLDASAFPEALGANPQITIAALAIQGARRILDGA